jgi:hypothetical protein
MSKVLYPKGLGFRHERLRRGERWSSCPQVVYRLWWGIEPSSFCLETKPSLNTALSAGVQLYSSPQSGGRQRRFIGLTLPFGSALRLQSAEAARLKAKIEEVYV